MKNSKKPPLLGSKWHFKRYGGFISTGDKVSAFYDEFRNEVALLSSDIRSRLSKIYQEDFLLLDQLELLE